MNLLLTFILTLFMCLTAQATVRPQYPKLFDTPKVDLAAGNIVVGNSSNKAASVNPSGQVDISDAGVISIVDGQVVNADLADATITAAKISNTQGAMKVQCATFTAAALVAAGSGVSAVAGDFIPDNSIIFGGWYEVTQTFAGNGDDSSLISIGVEDQDDDLKADAAIKTGTPWDAAAPAVLTLVNAFDDPSKWIKLSAQRKLSARWTVAATDTTLSAGSMQVCVLFFVGQ